MAGQAIGTVPAGMGAAQVNLPPAAAPGAMQAPAAQHGVAAANPTVPGNFTIVGQAAAVKPEVETLESKVAGKCLDPRGLAGSTKGVMVSTFATRDDAEDALKQKNGSFVNAPLWVELELEPETRELLDLLKSNSNHVEQEGEVGIEKAKWVLKGAVDHLKTKGFRPPKRVNKASVDDDGKRGDMSFGDFLKDLKSTMKEEREESARILSSKLNSISGLTSEMAGVTSAHTPNPKSKKAQRRDEGTASTAASGTGSFAAPTSGASIFGSSGGSDGLTARLFSGVDSDQKQREEEEARQREQTRLNLDAERMRYRSILAQQEEQAKDLERARAAAARKAEEEEVLRKQEEELRMMREEAARRDEALKKAAEDSKRGTATSGPTLGAGFAAAAAGSGFLGFAPGASLGAGMPAGSASGPVSPVGGAPLGAKAPGSGMPIPGSADKAKLKEEEQEEIKAHKAAALICTNDKAQDQMIFAQRVERERTKQQDAGEAAQLVSKEMNDDAARQLKTGLIQTMANETKEWLTVNGRVGPGKERKWEAGRCLAVVPPELLGFVSGVNVQEMVPMLEVDLVEWSMQFTGKEVLYAKDVMLKVCVREWRDLWKAGVVFHHMLRSFNLILVDAQITHKPAVLALSLLSARQQLRMQGMIERGQPLDQPAAQLKQAMDTRDEINKKVAAAAAAAMAEGGGGAAGE